MVESYEIVREIGIDAGHRVTHHGSKCKNLHGHRYTIQATCRGALGSAGEQEGMVIDFGFLKEEMMRVIDAPCDHGTVLGIDDPWLPRLSEAGLLEEPLTALREGVAAAGFRETRWFGGKLYLLSGVPTAENLARHWFQRLAPGIPQRAEGRATLIRVRVWETPSSFADYPVA